MDNYIKPQSDKNKPSSSMWTLSYRLHGITIALGLAVIYCYFYLHYWHKPLLIASVIFGYFVGWVIGKFTYRRD